MMRRLPDEGGNTWFMGSLVTQYWIDEETGANEVHLANGKVFRKETPSPFGQYTEITTTPAQGNAPPIKRTGE